ncbi:MAG TPA: type I DNA topoisomerase [Burkholderiales bacterium]|nr:type I DNA topoisomerase [Burkholderiales bacterium]
MAHNLLIVESPSKAKTLKKYLGQDFEVLASYGHVRDLEAKEGAVDPQHDFAMRYALIEKNKKHVDAIARAAEGADQILLATDPDREGEAIAWHLSEILRGRKSLRSRPLRRVVFYEITESAVKEGVNHPRDISMPLVNAQQARRALDHLVGFNLSPLLWRKIGPSLSAGRVQSPALRLIVERELEIEAFKSQEYWTIHLDSHKEEEKFRARLTHFRNEKLEQYAIANATRQEEIVAALTKAAKGTATVLKVERKPKSRAPAAPFITSTLQQEAVRKLGMSAERAMRTAQQLYEGIDLDGGSVGLITYMRTDSTNLAAEAVGEIRNYIASNFSEAYLPKSAVEYKSKSKNAQEAHEAIRPTSIFRTPDEVRGHLTPDQARLYEMIWKRTVACQMAAARYDTTAVDIGVGKKEGVFRATGQVLAFPGFIAVYQEGADDVKEEGEERLPTLEEGEHVPVDQITGQQHFTLPPPRYTEASLVKRLEEYGIGRPSTYASIISTLLDRGYAMLDKKRFVPTDLGRVVNGFLTAHFGRYVDYAFTAEMEEELDQISNGELDWMNVLRQFWEPFVGTLTEKGETGRGVPLPAASEPISTWKEYAQRILDDEWNQAGRPTESCPKCSSMVLLQNSRRGLFVGCSAYPKCDYTRPWDSPPVEGVPLGTDPASNLEITLYKGPFGYYVQLGPNVEGTKPKRAKWPQEWPIPREASDEVLQKALRLLSLPRTLGKHPETGKPVEASIGRFGPYVKHDTTFKSIPKSESVYDIALDRALELLAQPKAQRGGGAGRDLGEHPIDHKMVSLMEGRYGPYIKHGNVNVTVPSDMDAAAVTLEDAIDLLAEKAARELAKSGSTAAPIPLAQQTPGNRGRQLNANVPSGLREGRGGSAGRQSPNGRQPPSGGRQARGPQRSPANTIGGNRPPASRAQPPSGNHKPQPPSRKASGNGQRAPGAAKAAPTRGNAKPGSRRRPV